jgi:hypothetical protein
MQAAADTIIPAAARQAQNAAATHKTQQTHSQALAWLCKAAGPAALATVRLASQLVNIPHPAQSVVSTLVFGGVRVPFDELVSTTTAGTWLWGRIIALGEVILCVKHNNKGHEC